MCTRKVNSHDLEGSCISTAVQNEATCLRSLFTTTFNKSKALLVLHWELHSCYHGGRDAAPSLACCTERRELAGESHLGVLFDDSGWPRWLALGSPQHLFSKDAWTVMLSESDPRRSWPCRERWAWHTLPVFVLVRTENRHLEGKPHGEGCQHQGRCRDWYNHVPRRIKKKQKKNVSRDLKLWKIIILSVLGDVKE